MTKLDQAIVEEDNLNYDDVITPQHPIRPDRVTISLSFSECLVLSLKRVYCIRAWCSTISGILMVQDLSKHAKHLLHPENLFHQRSTSLLACGHASCSSWASSRRSNGHYVCIPAFWLAVVHYFASPLPLSFMFRGHLFCLCALFFCAFLYGVHCLIALSFPVCSPRLAPVLSINSSTYTSVPIPRTALLFWSPLLRFLF